MEVSLETFLPKDILNNILYKYLTYEDLIKFYFPNILDHITIYSRRIYKFAYPSTGDDVEYSILLDNKILIDYTKNILVGVVDNIIYKVFKYHHFYEVMHFINIQIPTNRDCKITVSIANNEDTSFVTGFKEYKIFEIDKPLKLEHI